VGQFQQRCRGYGYGLVVQLDHRQLDQWRFILEHIWLLMAIIFGQEQLESCLMDRFQQRYRGYEYDLVEQLNHMQPGRLMFDLGHIWLLMAMISLIKQR
jgi:hypothetical protein